MRVWVAGLTIGGAVNKAQNSTVSAFLYAVSGTSDLLVVPSQYFYIVIPASAEMPGTDSMSHTPTGNWDSGTLPCVLPRG